MKERIKALLIGIMLASVLLSIIIGVILIFDISVINSIDIQDNPLLEQFNDKELVESYREIHKKTRQIFFYKQDRVEIGRYILAGFLILFFLSFQMNQLLNKRVPTVRDITNSGVLKDELQPSFYAVIFTGILIAGTGIIFSLFSEPDIKKPEFIIEGPEKIYKNWPAFRGPNGSAYYDSNHITTQWNVETGENITWKVEVPVHGFNSPVVWDDHIYLTGGSPELFVIYCYDYHTGQLIWDYEVFKGDGVIPEVTSDTGFAAATSTVNSLGIYSIFANGEVLALDHKGHLRWNKSLGQPDNHYGHSSSLLMQEQTLFIQFDHSEKGTLYGINAINGDIKYEINRDLGTSWTSPILAERDGVDYLVLSSNPYVITYSPESGEELWRTDCLAGEVGSSPLYNNDLLYVATDILDIVALDLVTGEVIWTNYDILPNTSSPAGTKDTIYVASSYGLLGAYDAKSGDLIWEYEDLSHKGAYSSPIVVGESIYFIDRDGLVLIFDTNDNSLISSIEMNELIDTTPAFYKDSIIIRSNKHLYRIDEHGSNNE